MVVHFEFAEPFLHANRLDDSKTTTKTTTTTNLSEWKYCKRCETNDCNHDNHNQRVINSESEESLRWCLFSFHSIFELAPAAIDLAFVSSLSVLLTITS